MEIDTSHYLESWAEPGYYIEAVAGDGGAFKGV